MMFLKPDPFHFCFKWIMNWRGKLRIDHWFEFVYIQKFTGF
jgi:hypothetical protein